MDTQPLSRREHTMMKLLCNGKRQAQIAKHMRCTMGTVGVYMSRCRAKLGAKTNAQAAVLYLKLPLPLLADAQIGVSDDAPAVALVQPQPQGDSLTDTGTQVPAPDAPGGGNGAGVQADQHPLNPAADPGPALDPTSGPATASAGLLGG